MTTNYETFTDEELFNEWQRLTHAMQSGVAFEMNDPAITATEPKHLRVGINAAMSDHGGLVELLVAKGVFTEREYMLAIVRKMREEVGHYEARANAKLGGPGEKRVTFG